MKINQGLKRAVITFVLLFGMAQFVFFMLGRMGIDFFGQDILALIAAGWGAYWVYQKTEFHNF